MRTGFENSLPQRLDQSIVTTQYLGLGHGQLRVAQCGRCEESGQVDAGVESVAQQHRNNNGVSVAVVCNTVKDLIDGRRIEIEKRQPDIETWLGFTKSRHGSRDRPSGTGITASVCNSNERNHLLRRARPIRQRK